jgi:serine/threonine-protein kinase
MDPNAPPVSTTGRVLVRSTPEGATVKIGEQTYEGVTPMEIPGLDPGTYSVIIEHDGYQPHTAEVVVSAGQDATVEAELERRERRPSAPSGPAGMLSVNTRPWSKVYLGNRLLGTTPIGSVRVPSGSARLRFVDRDGNTHRRTVQVPANDHARAFFDLPQ